MRRLRMAAMWVAWALVVVGAAPMAIANGPVDHERFAVAFGPVEDPFFTAACETAVTEAVSSKGHVTSFADGSFKVHFNDAVVWASATGTVDLRSATTIHFQPEEVVENPDGTVTISLPHRQTGMPAKLNAAGSPPVVDAGWIDWEIQMVVDPGTGDVLDEFELLIDTAGQHPIVEGDIDFVGFVCDALAT